MKIGIIGAGIFGMTTAIKLAELGHQVEVFEKQKDTINNNKEILVTIFFIKIFTRVY